MQKLDKQLLNTLQTNYIMAKALYETTKGIAYEIQKRILEEHEFYESPDKSAIPKRIYDPDKTWLMDQEEDFQEYLDLTYQEYLQAGIADPRGRDYRPEAEEEELFRNAEYELLDYAIQIIPDSHVSKETLYKAMNSTKHRETMLNLILSLKL